MGWMVKATPRQLCHMEWSGTHCVEGWVGPRSSGRVREISPLPGFEHRTVQHVATRYTDWAIPAPYVCILRVFKLRSPYASLHIKWLDDGKQRIDKHVEESDCDISWGTVH